MVDRHTPPEIYDWRYLALSLALFKVRPEDLVRIIFLLLCSFLAAKAYAGSIKSIDRSCFVLVDDDPIALHSDAGRTAAGAAVGDPEQRGPITGKEAALLIRDLQHVPLAGGGWTVRAVRDGGRLSPQRTQILVGDVRAALAELHGRELLDVLRKIPDTRPEELEALKKSVSDITRCSADHFGGENDHQQTLSVVRGRREELEAVILAPVGTRAPVGPPVGRKTRGR